MTDVMDVCVVPISVVADQTSALGGALALLSVELILRMRANLGRATRTQPMRLADRYAGSGRLTGPTTDFDALTSFLLNVLEDLCAPTPWLEKTGSRLSMMKRRQWSLAELDLELGSYLVWGRFSCSGWTPQRPNTATGCHGSDLPSSG